MFKHWRVYYQSVHNNFEDNKGMANDYWICICNHEWRAASVLDADANLG